jgi:hypothetical protein
MAMTNELKTRRDALRKILGALGAAAALSDAEVSRLLAQVKKVPDLAKLAEIQTSDSAVKALKVLLAPKGREALVFESEYGRKPARTPSRDKTGKLACQAFLGIGGACNDLGCGLVVCNGLGLDMQLGGGWQPKGPGNVSEAGVYNKQMGCTQACTRCDKIVVPATAGARINPVWLRSVQADPYIKGLMTEYGVDGAEALEAQLEEALAQRRAGR